MSKVNDGGPAFAALATTAMGDVHHQPGMSLRDWFAGQALAGLLANSGGPIQANGHSGWQYTNCTIDSVATEAYRVADALLQSREATNETQ